MTDKIKFTTGGEIYEMKMDSWQRSNVSPKPDPLVEALDSLGLRKADEWAGDIRKALAARGLEIREKG